MTQSEAVHRTEADLIEDAFDGADEEDMDFYLGKFCSSDA